MENPKRLSDAKRISQLESRVSEMEKQAAILLSSYNRYTGKQSVAVERGAFTRGYCDDSEQSIEDRVRQQVLDVAEAACRAVNNLRQQAVSELR